MNSRRISLAIATVVTIFSGTTLPSHADRSCPLGFTAGSLGCQKVVKVTIENICTDREFIRNKNFRHDIRVGQDLCRKDNPVLGVSQGNIINSVANPIAKQKAMEKLTREIDPGFTNPGTPSKQRKVVATSEQVLIDYDNTTKQDYTEIIFEIVILRNSPF
jgi:hypothetical protein